MAKKIEDGVAEVDIQEMPLKTLDDYAAYNKVARKMNREAKKVVYKMKIPPSDMHPHMKVKFQRIDQPENVLKAYLSNIEIDWRGQLKSGGIYDLPVPVIDFLNDLATPIFSEVKNPDGLTTETKQTGSLNRFSCNPVSNRTRR